MIINLLSAIGNISQNWDSPDPNLQRNARIGCVLLIILPLVIIVILVLMIRAL